MRGRRARGRGRGGRSLHKSGRLPHWGTRAAMTAPPTRPVAMLDTSSDLDQHQPDAITNTQHNQTRDEDRGMTTSRRPLSPAVAVAVNRSKEGKELDRNEAAGRGRERGRETRENREYRHPPTVEDERAARTGSRHRHRSRDRSRDRDHRHSHRSPHSTSSRRRRDDSRPSVRDSYRERDRRDRDRELFPEREREIDRASQRHSRHAAGAREKEGSHSRPERDNWPPARSPAKRLRSPSPDPRDSQGRKSRRTHSPHHHPDENRPTTSYSHSSRNPDKASRSYRESPPPPRRPRSPDHREKDIDRERDRDRDRDGHARHRGSGRHARSRSASRNRPPRPSSRSSTTRHRPSSRTRNIGSNHEDQPRQIPRHRSPSPEPHYQASSRRQSPGAARPERPPASSDIARSRRRPTPESQGNSSRPVPPAPRSPRDNSKSASTKARRKSKDHSRPSSSGKFDPTSGANSIEVNMVPRGGFRGGYQYPQNTSGHGTPNSGYHGSPAGHSPFGGHGRGWPSQQQQFSPQHQYPPQYPHSGHNSPNGSQSRFLSHSPPYPPSGPAAQQYPQGPSFRGNHRGGPRGGQFGPGRGGFRGGFKNAQWNANAHAANANAISITGGRGQSISNEPPSGPAHADSSQATGHVATQDDSDNPFRPPKDYQVEDTSKSDRQDTEEQQQQMPPPSRPPPTGPAQLQSNANKFSFAFKAPSKPAAVAVPKPEISSKFNAAPPRAAQQPQQHQQSHRNDRDRDRRDLPRNVPTAPASSRSRGGDQRRQQEPRQQESRQQDSRHQQRQPQAPPPAKPQERAEPPLPRTRMIKKIMRRRIEKVPLEPELAASDSVFFRKPGDKSVIGAGTYGKVFKGLNVYTKKLVALKKIKMEGERDGFPVTAVREVKLLQSLRHPNVVDLQEVMVEKNDCFMVFEYLSHDLTGLLNHPSYKLDPAQKKHLAKQMFEGLDYLHKRGVLHRDIKAANILVSSEGILKLADFGLARFYAKRHQLDYTNRVVTIWYRSPELLLGETQYGPAVDIWSAACVLVEIFTRSPIFPGDGHEISQLEKIYDVLGTPNKQEWPNLVEMPWFELLRPGYRKRSVFADKYKERVTPAAFDLLTALFRYDPDRRPTAAEVLEHDYFASEEPAPRQAVELATIDGDWHELESKALRKENERKEREARKAAAKEAAAAGTSNNANASSSTNREPTKDNRDRKRPNEATDSQRESKRVHTETAHPTAAHHNRPAEGTAV